jgi:hypothetical protein
MSSFTQWDIYPIGLMLVLVLCLVLLLIYHVRSRKHQVFRRRLVEPCGPRGILYSESEREKHKIQILRLVK